MLVLIGWSQMTTTLPVYLNRNFGVTEQWYGLLMSLNATLVVLLQFPITRFTHRYARAPMMALGAALFAIGTGLYGIVSTLPLFFLAQAIWTTGEMVAMPVSQAFVADVAPPAMRGRYMGVFGMVWTVAFGIGPLAGGAIIDRFDDRLVWAAVFAIELVAVAGFLALGRALRPTRPPASV
jgi:MFS family permease